MKEALLNALVWIAVGFAAAMIGIASASAKNARSKHAHDHTAPSATHGDSR